MATQITVMLAVNDGNAAIHFYKAAFVAELLWHLEGNGQVVAGLSIAGARFFLAHESHDTRAPSSAGFTTLRIELFVDDPVAVHQRAVAAGASEQNPIATHEYAVSGPQPIGRMLQGAGVDPFGHRWLVGRIL